MTDWQQQIAAAKYHALEAQAPSTIDPRLEMDQAYLHLAIAEALKPETEEPAAS